MKKRTAILIGLGLVSLAIKACQTYAAPKGAKVVKDLDIQKYLGKWYEIARFDYRFERDLNNTTATYSLQEDGSIEVRNKGFNRKSQQWTESIGKAKFVSKANEGRLKVSFFGPFYSSYNIIALDQEYQYALIAGKNLDYLWILSRSPRIPKKIIQEYLQIAMQLGYDIEQLIWVHHD